MSETLSNAGPVTITIGGYIRCHDCRHWDKPAQCLYGLCRKQGSEQPVQALYDTQCEYVDAMLWTRPGFSCSEGRLKGASDERD